MTKFKVIISGGGTGGHIFPAIAIAKAIEKKAKNVEFLFVGAKGRMEMEKIPAEGYNIKGLWISGLQRRLTYKNILFPIKLIYSLLKSMIILYDFKPDIVIGTGGYASGPLLFAASIKGIPTIIQEQNSYPGITNKILSKYVQKICVAYDKMERYFPEDKIVVTGNPIRQDILSYIDKHKSPSKLFSINKENPTVLIIGGSLGAKTINNAIANQIYFFKENNINLIWQTGVNFKKEKIEDFLKDNHTGINIVDFIKDMALVYSLADIVVSRAGAIAISELCCIGKPVILVPSPNVSENHQYKNAQSLVNKKAAILVEDIHANRKLVNSIFNLINSQDLQNDLINNIQNMKIINASDKIAEIVFKIVR